MKRAFTALFVLMAPSVQADDLEGACDDLRVQGLVATLEGIGEAKRTAAAVALRSLGQAGLPALLRGVKSESPYARAACMMALRDVKPYRAEIIPTLIEASRSGSEREQNAAHVTLVLYAEVARDHLGYFMQAALGKENMSRELAYLGLARLGPTAQTVPLMVEALRDGDDRVQFVAVGVLAYQDWFEFADRWHTPDRVRDAVSWKSFWTEEEFAPHRPRVLAELVSLLRTARSERVRARAANALGRADQLPPGGQQALINALGDVGWGVPDRAAVSLARLVERGVVPKEVLKPMLESGDKAQQCSASEVAWRLGPEARWALPWLRKAWVGMDSLLVKQMTAAALGKMGAADDEMIGQLAAGYAKTPPYREDARDQLAQWLVATNDAYQALLEAATGKRRVDVRWYRGLDRDDAVQALVAFPNKRAVTIPVMMKLLRDPSWHVRFRAAEGLYRLGEPADKYVDELGILIDQAETFYLLEATRLLLVIQPRSQRPVPRLLRALGEKSITTSQLAELLSEIGNLPQTAKAPLLRAAQSEDDLLRAGAVRALGHLKVQDDEIRALLWSATNAETYYVRSAAIESLFRGPCSDEELKRLLPRALVLNYSPGREACFKALKSRPANVAAAVPLLVGMAQRDEQLPLVLLSLEIIAPQSKAVRDVHLRLIQSGEQRVHQGAIARGERGDQAFVAPLSKRLLNLQWLGRWGLSSPMANAVLEVADPKEVARIAAALERVLEQPSTKREALVALGEMGRRAQRATDAVRSLEADPVLGATARETLSKITR